MSMIPLMTPSATTFNFPTSRTAPVTFVSLACISLHIDLPIPVMAMRHQAPPTFKEKWTMGEQREKICKESRQRWDRLCFNNRVNNV